MSRFQLQDIFAETKSVEVESWSETDSLCRYFQRGVCNKGSLCEFSHDLAAKRSTCKYFMSEMVWNTTNFFKDIPLISDLLLLDCACGV